MKRIFIISTLFMGLLFAANLASAQSMPQVFVYEQSMSDACSPTLQLAPATETQRQQAIQLIQNGLVPVYEGNLSMGLDQSLQRTQSADVLPSSDYLCVPSSSIIDQNAQGQIFLQESQPGQFFNYNGLGSPNSNVYPQIYGGYMR